MIRFALLILLLPLTLVAAEPAWQKIEGCTIVADGYRDGDSFLVRIAPRTYRVFRLYFVDACEGSADQRYPERVVDQAKYFGVSQPRAFELGDAAAAFTDKALSKPFAVWTLWQPAPGASSRQRFYAFVSAGGGDLGEQLIEAGLARIYGKRITTPDGWSSKNYLIKLTALEKVAKEKAVGGWSKR